MSLILKRPWTRRPQAGSTPNPKLGLTSLILPGVSSFDLASGNRLSSTTGSVSVGVGEDGPELVVSGSNASIYGVATVQSKSEEMSLIWAGSFLGAASSDACIGGITYDGANNPPYVRAEIKRYAGGTNNVILNYSAGATNYTLSIPSPPVSGRVVIIGTSRDGRHTLDIFSAPGIWLSASDTQAGAMSSTASARIEIGDSLNARSPNARCAVFGVANRIWSENERRELLTNPWQLFAPLPRRIWAPDAAGGGNTVAVPAGALTLSGLIPTVTASTHYVSVPAGALTITGYAPDVSNGAASSFIRYFDVLSGNILILRAL